MKLNNESECWLLAAWSSRAAAVRHTASWWRSVDSCWPSDGDVQRRLTQPATCERSHPSLTASSTRTSLSHTHTHTHTSTRLQPSYPRT